MPSLQMGGRSLLQLTGQDEEENWRYRAWYTRQSVGQEPPQGIEGLNSCPRDTGSPVIPPVGQLVPLVGRLTMRGGEWRAQLPKTNFHEVWMSARAIPQWR